MTKCKWILPSSYKYRTETILYMHSIIECVCVGKITATKINVANHLFVIIKSLKSTVGIMHGHTCKCIMQLID